LIDVTTCTCTFSGDAMKKTTDNRMAKVEARYGKTLGASKGSKPAPPVKVKPTGNPLKGKVGVKATWKF
jgi:hypothetical protein